MSVDIRAEKKQEQIPLSSNFNKPETKMWMILGKKLHNNEKQDWVIFCPYTTPFIPETLFS